MGAYFYTESYASQLPNFLASEVGLIQRSVLVSDSGVSADSEGRKFVKAGTVLPSNDANAKGILFETVEVTNGSKLGSLIVAGRIHGNRLHTAAASAAQTPLKASGIVFEDCTAVTR